MKNLTAIKKVEDAVQREKASLEKRIKELDGRLAKTRKGYDFVCKKCGIALKKSECGYRMWKYGRTEQDCQPMGDYDIWQTVSQEARYCCPKCGHDFGESYGLYDTLAQTRRYGRWEDGRPNLFQGWQFDEPMDEDIYVHKGKKLIRRHLPLKGKEAQRRAS